jgi:hypothetical protein
MATKKRSDASDEAPPFVFRGTVKKLRSATMKAVPVGDRTAVVHVEQVIEAPEAFAHYAGQDITVELAGRAKISAGDELIFHAHSWMFGDSVAVRSEAQERVTAKHAAALTQGGDPTENRQSRRLEEHVNDADLVVSGQVSAVTIPPEIAEHVRAADERPPAPVSEHDPKWRQAVIQVNETHRGSHDSNQVTVLFPSSMDVRWYRAPKFQAGQKGLFVLHKTKIRTEEHHALRALAEAAGTPEVEVYTALHPEDVQPLTQQASIKAKIR